MLYEQEQITIYFYICSLLPFAAIIYMKNKENQQNKLYLDAATWSLVGKAIAGRSIIVFPKGYVCLWKHTISIVGK